MGVSPCRNGYKTSFIVYNGRSEYIFIVYPIFMDLVDLKKKKNDLKALFYEAIVSMLLYEMIIFIRNLIVRECPTFMAMCRT